MTLVEGHLTWHRAEVEGRPAVYGVGGPDGPPVVFLHGWGLGSRAYKRAINRLTARGCRVYAPALPSFGGSADLPGEKMDLKGYADWVANFIEGVEIDEPVLLVGHSFGGGVAITLSDRHPHLVSYLVLLNAVGGVSSRTSWAWAIGLGRELWPVGQAVELAEAVRQDVVRNLFRNPLGMLRAARLAQRADLRDELTSVQARGLPVLVLTSESDAVIPRGAFEALCRAIGTDGKVVYGGHSWLLANPDAFDEVMRAFVDLKVAEYRTTKAPGRAAEILRLLRETKLPARTVRAMLRGAPPLWLMSDPAQVLAADMALCFPGLGPGEVRAAARPVEGTQAVRVSIVATDRRGLLADSAAVLACHGLSITRASAATWKRRHLALHSLVVENGSGLDEAAWQRIGDDLRTMIRFGGEKPLVSAVPSAQIEIQGTGAGRSLIEVTASDQLGLLSVLCRCFAELGADIESMQARTFRDSAHDTFLVVGDLDAKAVSERLNRRVIEWSPESLPTPSPRRRLQLVKALG